jgi:hypothetical protein
MFLTTMIALQQLPAQSLGPALENILHRPAMAGQQVLSKPMQVVAPTELQDVRHIWHAHAPTCLEVCHQGVDGGMHDVEGFVREMGVAHGSTGAFVPEELLDDAQ